MKLKDVLRAMEFTLNQRISFHIIDIQQEKGNGETKLIGVSNLASIVAVRVPFPENELENIDNIFTGISNSDDIAIIAYQSYFKGIEVENGTMKQFLIFSKQ
ncbi:hypothetical protein [Paenibacillus lautus]|uniref:hypothetical protein n=1 Tax=Paenibacillus lautus TaxID=1401 RepID=UPI000BBDF88E|nr:hypothetical protein [Paenibacillus lautus]PCL95025.1 hypothetical protein CPZ30_04850 [Paenibacillus lautus]